MEFVNLFKEIIMVLLICNTSWSISVEPKYTKFLYEEQILEKMVRLELFVENMENKTKKFISDTTTLVQEMKNSATSELNKMAERIDRLESEMDRFQSNVTALGKAAYADSEGSDAIVFNAYSVIAQSNNPVIFEKVNLNEGNGYDKSSGVFTAPADGIYQFNAQLCINKDYDLEYSILVASVKIVKGEFRAASDSGDEKCTSFSAVYIVRKDETVTVSAGSASLDASTDDPHYFSGALLKRL